MATAQEEAARTRISQLLQIISSPPDVGNYDNRHINWNGNTPAQRAAIAELQSYGITNADPTVRAAIRQAAPTLTATLSGGSGSPFGSGFLGQTWNQTVGPGSFIGDEVLAGSQNYYATHTNEINALALAAITYGAFSGSEAGATGSTGGEAAVGGTGDGAVLGTGTVNPAAGMTETALPPATAGGAGISTGDAAAVGAGAAASGGGSGSAGSTYAGDALGPTTAQLGMESVNPGNYSTVPIGSGYNLGSVGTGGSNLGALIGAIGSIGQGIAIGDAGSAAAAAADPFASQRGQYQTLLSRLVNDPNSFLSSPIFKAEQEAGVSTVERSNAAKGRLGSGNILTELYDYGSGVASSEFYKQADLLATLSGARTSNPAAAGQLGLQGTTGSINAYSNAAANLINYFGYGA